MLTFLHHLPTLLETILGLMMGINYLVTVAGLILYVRQNQRWVLGSFSFGFAISIASYFVNHFNNIKDETDPLSYDAMMSYAGREFGHYMITTIAIFLVVSLITHACEHYKTRKSEQTPEILAANNPKVVQTEIHIDVNITKPTLDEYMETTRKINLD